MISYKLPTGEKRTIDNKFEIGSTINRLNEKNEVIEIGIITKIYNTYSGLYYVIEDVYEKEFILKEELLCDIKV